MTSTNKDKDELKQNKHRETILTTLIGKWGESDLEPGKLERESEG